MCGDRFKKYLSIVLAGLTILAFAALATAGGHGEEKPVKKGILLVTFGTSIPEAQKVFDNIDASAKARFKGVPVRWAFTAKMIRKKLAKEGRITLSPSQALAKMAEDGFTHAAVQSLHIIPGQEFHQMYDTVKRFQGMPKGIEKITVGLPLLASTGDMERTAGAVLANAPKERKPGEALVLMGHGTHHPANVYYPALNYVIQKADPNVFVGTVEGYPEIRHVMADLAAKGIKKAWLMPLMSVAGDHARNDMAGEEEDSWRSTLEKAGIECGIKLVGLAAFPGIVEIWMDHLDEAMKNLD